MEPLYVGLMSGTSADAADAALVSVSRSRIELRAHCSLPMPAELHQTLRDLERGASDSPVLDALGTADAAFGEWFAEAVALLLRTAACGPDQIRAIGSHGQTVRHQPHARRPFTLQIGDPNRIAEITGITTVADFRRRDVAAGGQGAPLVPIAHEALFRHPVESRAVLNLGGMANLTVLPADAGTPVTGFDTGPGNVLLDAWRKVHTNEAMDREGAWAAQGQVNGPLLKKALADPYFARPAPKSTGREYFNPEWLQRILATVQPVPAAVDVQATLAEITARSAAEAILSQGLSIERLLVCGGGALNAHLMGRLAALLPGIVVETTARHSLDPQWIEAVAFAYLAHRTMEGLPGNLPAVTGARRPVVLGGIYPGR